MGSDISDEELIDTARQVVAEGRAHLRDAKDTRGKAVDWISARAAESLSRRQIESEPHGAHAP